MSYSDLARYRDSKGRFVKGNPGGPGRPTKAYEENYKEAFKDAISREDFQDVVHEVLKKAQKGNLTAAKLIIEYVMGKPDQAIVNYNDEILRIEVVNNADETNKPTYPALEASGDIIDQSEI